MLQDYNFPIFEIKKSKVMKLMFKEKKPISAFVEEGGLKKYLYSEINDQFKQLIEYIDNIK